MRIRLAWCVLLSSLATANGAQAADRPYHLALGDSLAVGIQPAANGDYVPTNQGYVDHLYAFYRTHVPGLRLAKLGCSGETTSSMISGEGSGCLYPEGSQLSQAIAFLLAHPNQVALITLDIGGDNLLQCFSLTEPIQPACVTDAASTAAGDLFQILGTLRAYAPQALIVGMNYYDPFLAAFVFGPAGRTLATVSLLATNAFNQALQGVYGLLQIPMADVAAAFRINNFPGNVAIALTWTWMGAQPPRGPDVHPNAFGYFAIASAVARAISSP